MTPAIDTLVYSKAVGKFEVGLIGALEGMIPAGHMEICRCLEDLSVRLRKPHYQPTILVLVPADADDLKDILVVQPILEGSRIVLVLPDGSASTATMGHSLRPRFVAYRDNGFQEVTDVLARMTGIGTNGHAGGAMTDPPLRRS
jgi:hypothetical protein